ncbi:MAG TPA: hypothetical protein VKA81_04935, partial [Verrucomicrobiae bacterium]|nr:hypothetical protein [Verrucomicrobiae bacterium]
MATGAQSLNVIPAIGIKPIGIILYQDLAEAINVLERRTQVMRNRITEGFELLVGCFQFDGAKFQFLVQLGNLLFHLFASSDIANCACDDRSVVQCQRLCAHLDWEFPTVLVQTTKLQSRCRHPAGTLGEVSGVVLPLGLPKTFRNQQGHALALEFPVA